MPPKWSKDYVVEGQDKRHGGGGGGAGSDARGSGVLEGGVESVAADAASEDGSFSFGEGWSPEGGGDEFRGNKVSGGIAALGDDAETGGGGSRRMLLDDEVEDEDRCRPGGETDAMTSAERRGWKLNSVTDCIAG